MKSLTAYAPKSIATDTTFKHLADLSWADKRPLSVDPIDLIIGADLYGELILEGIRRGANGQPIAQNSVLGWVISGPVVINAKASQSLPNTSPTNATVHHCFTSLTLDQELRRFWEDEELPHQPTVSAQEAQCEEHFRATHSRLSNGRYVVRLPFKRGPPIDIGRSQVIAERMLNCLTRKFTFNPAHASDYSEFLREYESLGHMRRVVEAGQSPEQHVYIPHHPVIRDSSLSTRLRVVFNVSCATSNGSSLNDHLLVGPKLQADLPAVIIQWRQYKYVYSADITKMYRQILVDPRDVNYQRILWQPSAAEPPSEYQLLTVTYGTACALFLALCVIKQLVYDDGHKFPEASEILLNQIYVDNILFGDHEINRLREK